MQDINSVFLIGRLTRDISSDERSFFYTRNNVACAKVSIAVNRSVKQVDGQWADEVSYFDVAIWGKTAENIKQYLTKGKQIAVCGSLVQERWKAQDGTNRSRVIINALSVELLGGVSNQKQSADTTHIASVQEQSRKVYSVPTKESFQEDIPWENDGQMPDIDDIPF